MHLNTYESVTISLLLTGLGFIITYRHHIAAWREARLIKRVLMEQCHAVWNATVGQPTEVFVWYINRHNEKGWMLLQTLLDLQKFDANHSYLKQAPERWIAQVHIQHSANSVYFLCHPTLHLVAYNLISLVARIGDQSGETMVITAADHHQLMEEVLRVARIDIKTCAEYQLKTFAALIAEAVSRTKGTIKSQQLEQIRKAAEYPRGLFSQTHKPGIDLIFTNPGTA